MTDEVAAVVETMAPARPKMRVKLTFSHPTNTRPKVKMAKVDGCTFFRQVVTEGRGDEATTKVAWRHVDNSCERTDHWTHSIRLMIQSVDSSKVNSNIETLSGPVEVGLIRAPKINQWQHDQKTITQCTLIRSGGEWRHEGQPCAAAKACLETREKAKEATKVFDAETAKKEGEKKLDEKTRQELYLALKKFTTMEIPACLVIDKGAVPRFAGSCQFEMRGDIFHHLGKRCKKHTHDGGYNGYPIHLTRSPGGTRDEFAAKANEAIGQALALIPPNSGKHVTVDV